MKIQLALDTAKAQECVEIVDSVSGSVDIVEVGYPLLIQSGLSLVRSIKDAFPHIQVCADIKLHHSAYNSAYFTATRCIDEGADIVTVLGCGADHTIREVVRACNGRGASVTADLSGIRNMAKRAAELDEMGVGCVIAPTDFEDAGMAGTSDSFEPQGRLSRLMGEGPLDRARRVGESLSNAELGVVGNVNVTNAQSVAAIRPGVVLVGRGILNSPDPAEAARALKEALVLSSSR